MKALRVLLVLQFIGIAGYTFVAGTTHGWDLFSVFVGDLLAFTWPGQFNFDFLSYLTLSGIWVAWRHHFSGTGILLGIIAAIFGILFFAPYLFYALTRAKGEVHEILLGSQRAGRMTGQ